MKLYVVYFYNKCNTNNGFGVTSASSKCYDVPYNVFTVQGLDSLVNTIIETEKADNVVIINIIPLHDEKEKEELQR